MRVKSQSAAVIAGLALALLAPATALAQEAGEMRPPEVITSVAPTVSPPPRPSVITNPEWARAPEVVYPQAALSRDVEGWVVLTCTVTRVGRLVDCVVDDETPRGFGLAESALEGSATARVSPRTVDSLAVDARATYRTSYRLPERMTPGSPPLPSPTAPSYP